MVIIKRKKGKEKLFLNLIHLLEGYRMSTISFSGPSPLSKCDKNLQDFLLPSLDQGLLPTSHHFGNRRGEGPGDGVLVSTDFFRISGK